MARTASLAYCHHKSSGLAFVCLPGGRSLYLGRFDSPESYRRYRAVLAEVRAGTPKRELSMGELAEHYAEAMGAEFGSKAWQAVESRLLVIDRFREYAGLPHADFGPTALISIRRMLLAVPERGTDGLAGAKNSTSATSPNGGEPPYER